MPLQVLLASTRFYQSKRLLLKQVFTCSENEDVHQCAKQASSSIGRCNSDLVFESQKIGVAEPVSAVVKL